MIKNIIFDMGQVLIKFDPEYFIKRIGLTNEDDIKIIMKEVYKSLEWSMMDRGSLNEEQACERMIKRVPEHLKSYVPKLTSEWNRPIIPIDGAKDAIKELKNNGYNIYLLSNASLNHSNFWNKVPGSEYFDGIVVSSYIHLVKPQQEIFKYILDKFKLKAEECVFIDDSSLNVEGAVYAGMNGIVFHGDYKEVREKLSALNVKIEL